MKNVFAGLLILGMSLAMTTQAITIDLIPEYTQINAGDNLAVAVRISGLGDHNAPALGTYDVDFHFDSDRFDITDIIWGDRNLGNQLNLSGFGTLQDSQVSSSWMNVFELSFDDAQDLNWLQADEFTLFSVLLSASSMGNGGFSLSINAIGDAYGIDLPIDAIHNATVTVGRVSLPEPSSLLLLISMLAIVLYRKTRKA